MTDAARHQAWEERYGASVVWTGKVNAHLKEWVEAHPRLAPSTATPTADPSARAIDMACGEGGDAIWLASQGWRVTGVDFAKPAIDRAAAAAQARGVDVTWVLADLTAWVAEQPADLVLVSFVHESAHVRHAVWRAAARAVAAGGTLLITGHAPGKEDAPGPPPETRFTAAEVVAVLGESWRTEVREVHRQGIGGHAGQVVTDVIITLTR
jgi:SAM-dependent methyltransferase